MSEQPTQKPEFKRYDTEVVTKEVLYVNPYLEQRLAKLESQDEKRRFLEKLKDECNALVFRYISQRYTLQNYEEAGIEFRKETMHVELVIGEPIMAAPVIVDRILSLKGDKTKLNTRNGRLDFGERVNDNGYLEFYIFWHGFWS